MKSFVQEPVSGVASNDITLRGFPSCFPRNHMENVAKLLITPFFLPFSSHPAFLVPVLAVNEYVRKCKNFAPLIDHI